MGGDAPPYEAVPYPGGAFAQTHPDRLSALARLFVVTAPLPSRCRVLENGCGDGGKLLAMLVIDALQRVTQAWPAALAVASLWPPDAGAEHRAVICEALLRCYRGAVVELRAEPSAAA